MLVSKKQDWELYQEEVTPVVLVQKSTVNTALRVKCLTVVLLLAITAMFITIRSEVIIRAGYDLVQTKAQLIKAEKENELLRLDIAKLKSPQRIQAIATTELGMVVPANVYYAANDVKTSGDSNFVSAKEQTVWGTLSNVLHPGKAEASKGQ
jgi:cell division protein FtsL